MKLLIFLMLCSNTCLASKVTCSWPVDNGRNLTVYIGEVVSQPINAPYFKVVEKDTGIDYILPYNNCEIKLNSDL